MKQASTSVRAQIGQNKRDRTRQRLLHAAARVLAQHGDNGATIDNFISAADVARGTFYNYFDTRDALIDALWEQIGADPFHEIQAACSNLDDPALKLGYMMEMIIERAAQNKIWGWLVIHLANSERIMTHELADFPMTYLRAGLSAKALSYTDASAARDLVVGATISGIKAVLTGREGARYARALCTMTLKALSATRAKQAFLRRDPPHDYGAESDADNEVSNR